MFPSTGWERTVPGCWLCSRCSLRTMGLTCHGFSCALAQVSRARGGPEAGGPSVRRSLEGPLIAGVPGTCARRYIADQQRPVSAQLLEAWVFPVLQRLILPLQAFLPWFLIGAGCLLPGPCWLHPGTGFCCQHVGQECLHLVSLSILRPPYFCSKYLLMSLYNQSPQS